LVGPIGREFVGAIRDRYPDLQEATFEEIADHMRSYDPDQLPGVMSMVKGKLFERLVAYHENQDQDEWRAVLHEDESYPGSDIILTNDDTGETIEMSLKATDSVSYVEEALLKYPDIPVLTTEDVSQFFADDPSVSGAALSNEDLNRVTEENFDRMLTELTPFDVAGGAASGVAAGTAIGLWPFVVAFLRKRITQDQLEQACVRALGESGVALASRVSYAVVLGPIFAWYMLARGVMGLTRAANAQHARVRRLQWEARPRLN
ncbi:MAG: hypothetical protein VX656_01775, partial [Candidatus Latescibacterota bacterium]|nr:hypothetical protein [Candidatus Latescibacterota bacterium]